MHCWLWWRVRESIALAWGFVRPAVGGGAWSDGPGREGGEFLEAIRWCATVIVRVVSVVWCVAWLWSGRVRFGVVLDYLGLIQVGLGNLWGGRADSYERLVFGRTDMNLA